MTYLHDYKQLRFVSVFARLRALSAVNASAAWPGIQTIDNIQPEYFRLVNRSDLWLMFMSG
jgi:hypothetical protein